MEDRGHDALAALDFARRPANFELSLEFPARCGEQKRRHFQGFAQRRGLSNLPRKRRIDLFIIVRQVFAVGWREDRKETAAKPPFRMRGKSRCPWPSPCRKSETGSPPVFIQRREQHIIVAIKNRNRI